MWVGRLKVEESMNKLKRYEVDGEEIYSHEKHSYLYTI